MARLVASGLSNRQAAERLMVSDKAVEYHLGNIYAKLGVSSRSQLAARHDLRRPQDPARGPGILGISLGTSAFPSCILGTDACCHRGGERDVRFELECATDSTRR